MSGRSLTTRSSARNRKGKHAATATADVDDEVDSENRAETMLNRAGSSSSSSSPKKRRKTSTVYDYSVSAIKEEFFVLDNADTLDSVSVVDSEHKKSKEIQYSFANTFWEALNSSSPHIGAHCLTSRMLHQEQRIPCPQLWTKLLVLVTMGPKSDDSNDTAVCFFPDRIRMDAVVDYIRMLFETLPASVITEQLVKTIPSKTVWQQQIGCTPDLCYWQDVLQHVCKNPYYTAPGDLIMAYDDALQRLVQSVHAKACSVDVLVLLLESQAKNLVTLSTTTCNNNNNNTKPADILDKCHNTPMLCDMLSHRRRGGERQALQLAVQAYASQSILLGHFTSSSYTTGGDDDDDETLCDFVESLVLQASRLLASLARVSSYMVWLYQLQQQQSPNNNDSNHHALCATARLVSGWFQHELQEITTHGFAPPAAFLFQEHENDSSLVPVLEQHWAGIKLEFVLGFSKPIVPNGFRPALAEALGIAHTYNACFGIDTTTTV